MKIHRKNNFGFGLAVIIIGAVFLIGATYIGFLAYQNFNKSSNSTKPNNNSNMPNTTNNTADLFVVSELKINIKLPDALSDLIYHVSVDANGNPIIFFNTKSLEKMDGVNSLCKTEDGPIGVMWRMSQDPKTVNGSGATSSKLIGSSYVVYQHPQASCSNNIATSDFQTSQAKLLQDALSTANEVK